MRFFFDNMVPPGVPPYLQSLSKEHQIIHKKERFPRDTPDEVWINDLAGDGHWNIVTADLGIASVAHIAEALSQAGHTAFFLTKGWGNLPTKEISWKYPKAWWQIEEAASKPVHKGAWFKIGPTSHKPKLYTR